MKSSNKEPNYEVNYQTNHFSIQVHFYDDNSTGGTDENK